MEPSRLASFVPGFLSHFKPVPMLVEVNKYACRARFHYIRPHYEALRLFVQSAFIEADVKLREHQPTSSPSNKETAVPSRIGAPVRWSEKRQNLTIIGNL